MAHGRERCLDGDTSCTTRRVGIDIDAALRQLQAADRDEDNRGAAGKADGCALSELKRGTTTLGNFNTVAGPEPSYRTVDCSNRPAVSIGYTNITNGDLDCRNLRPLDNLRRPHCPQPA